MDDPSSTTGGGGGGGGGSPNKGINGPVNKPKNWVNFTDNDESVSGNHEPAALDGSDSLHDDDSGHHNQQGHYPAVIEPSVEIHSPNSATTNHHHSNSNNVNNSNKINHPLQRPDGVVIHTGQLQTVELHQNSQENLSHSYTNAGNRNFTNNVGTGGGGQNGGQPNVRRNTSGFTNGDVIVSILPVNTKWPWVTPASFRPELVPEELMVPGLTLTVEEYVHAMEILTSDFRFNAYTICYKRLLAAWLSTAFFILLIILFSGVVGIQLFALGISWLIINAVAAFLCMYIKIKINQGLERCMGKVNKLLIKHKLIIGLDDRGRISCHKVHLCFIYFDPNDCVKRLEQMLESSGGDRQRVQNHLDACDVEIVISGAQNTTRIPRKQSEVLYLRYIQRWAKAFMRELATTKERTLHCPKQMCPCQFIGEVLQEKRDTGGLGALLMCRNMADTLPNTLAL